MLHKKDSFVVVEFPWYGNCDVISGIDISYSCLQGIGDITSGSSRIYGNFSAVTAFYESPPDVQENRGHFHRTNICHNYAGSF